MNGPAFRIRVERLLAPTLRPGDIVALDNLPAYRVAGVQAAVERAGKELRFFPLAAPTSTRSKWPSPSSRPASDTPPPTPPEPLWDAIARALDTFHPSRMPKLLPGRRV